MISSKIIDSHGSNRGVKVGERGELFVVQHAHPPEDEGDFMVPRRDYFRNDAGSNDMRVVGSLASPVIFSIDADEDRDIYIKNLSFVIADAGATLNNFGNISPLTNGVSLEWMTQDVGTTVINEGLKSNFDFVRLCGGHPAFGSGNSAFKANNVVGTSEAFFCELDAARVFGLQWGLRLRAGTNDSLRIIVKDDTSAVDQFDVLAYGASF